MAIRFDKKKKVGLVLSGGGIKAAAFHIGVCLALKEKGFRFAGGSKAQVQHNFPDDDPSIIKLYVGSSAGSFVASILASGYSIESLINAFQLGSNGRGQEALYDTQQSIKPIGYSDLFRVNGRNILKSIPLSLLKRAIMDGGFESLLKSKFKVNGFFTTKNLERYLDQNVLDQNDFASLGVGLYIVSTQLNHTRKVIFGDFPETSKTSRVMYANFAKISQAVAASTALPPVFAPYGIKRSDGKELFFFDGEIRDTLSTHVAVDHGADLVIASYSVQPYHYTPEIGSLSDFGIPAILNQALYQVIEQKIDRHITHQADIKAIHSSIDAYCKQNQLPMEHRDRILDIIAQRTRFNPNVDYIYINPRNQDYEMFFADHFSLNPRILEMIVRIGFKSAISALRRHNL